MAQKCTSGLARNLLTAALAVVVFGVSSSQAMAQVACFVGIVPDACTVAQGETVEGKVLTNGDGHTISNFGIIADDVITNRDNSYITNSGTIGGNIQTSGNESGITNSGTIDGRILTLRNNSGIINSGTISFVSTRGIGSGIINSGTAGSVAISGDQSNITNSGTVGSATISGVDSSINNTGVIARDASASGENNQITNSGTIGGRALTSRAGSRITNSGVIVGDARASGADSGITNSGIVRDLITRGINSEIINSGVVRGRVQADGDSSNVINSGVIEWFSSVNGDNSSFTNSGTIERTFNMRGQNPTLTLLGGSVFKSDIILGGGGTTTINVGAGLNLDILLRAGRPDVLNTRGAFVQKGKRLLVLDPTGFAASDVIIGDLTSAIFNAVGGSDALGGVDSHARVSTQGTGPGTGRPVWARAFGGVGAAAGDGAQTDIDSSVFGLIAGVDYGRFGVFGGGATSNAETEFDAQDVDVDSVFAGVTWRPELGGMDLQLALAAGMANHDLARRVANNTVPGGIEVATAEFDGWFIAPSVTVSSPFKIADRAAVGSVRLNYTALFRDGYTETGVARPLSVSGRTAHQLGAHAELAFPTIWRAKSGGQIRAEWNAGFEGNFSFGANDVSGALAGTAISFDGSADDRVSGFVGGSYGVTSASGLSSIVASAEAQISSAGGYKLGAGLTAHWSF